jgi:NAD(P)-dependent dehydrogenase (short-subunit alcohol dehydrogenase family)
MEYHPFALSGKTALVTGGGKRIGRANVLALAAEGTSVVVHYGRSRDEAEDAAAAARDRGVQAWTLQADLSQPGEAGRLFPQALDAAGPIDILVNNAAIFPPSKLVDFTADDLAQSVQINAFAPLQLARAFAAQGREGAIVNFLDTRITDYDRNNVAYHLSKRMLFSLTRMMAVEFAPAVRVNAVAPGLILPPPGGEESYLKKLVHTNPLRRVGSPEAIADAVLFLLRSNFITGQVLYVDGGRHMRGKMYT